MKLSRKKAIELCIELWTWLAKTGKKKEDWPKWEEYGYDIYGDCWFCEYDEQQIGRFHGDNCSYCPLVRKLRMTCSDDDCFYTKYRISRTPKTRKKYAKLFLEQIKQTA